MVKGHISGPDPTETVKPNPTKQDKNALDFSCTDYSATIDNLKNLGRKVSVPCNCVINFRFGDFLVLLYLSVITRSIGKMNKNPF